jgi:hypothetical protein
LSQSISKCSARFVDHGPAGAILGKRKTRKDNGLAAMRAQSVFEVLFE